MSLEEELLDKRIREEINRMTENVIAGSFDVRFYDRSIGGIHALRLVLEEFIPEIRKLLNER